MFSRCPYVVSNISYFFFWRLPPQLKTSDDTWNNHSIQLINTELITGTCKLTI